MTRATKKPNGATRLDAMIAALHKQNDALVNAATWIGAEFDHYGEVLQLGDGDDDGMYGPTSAIEQLRTALEAAK